MISKPLWNSNEALSATHFPLGIHFFFPALKISWLLSHWKDIYCGPHKPPLPISSSNIFCLLLINCSSLCTAEKRWRQMGGIISSIVSLTIAIPAPENSILLNTFFLQSGKWQCNNPKSSVKGLDSPSVHWENTQEPIKKELCVLREGKCTK